MKNSKTDAMLFDCIRKSADALHDSKLTDEVLGLDELCRVRDILNLTDCKESAAIAIMAALAVQPRHQSVDMGDMAQFLGCSELDAAALSAALKSLTVKGFIAVDNDWSGSVLQYRFAYGVLESIVENREVHPQPVSAVTHYDQFMFCDEVHKHLCNRKENRITTESLFREVMRTEDEHLDLEFVVKMRNELGEVKHRVIVYELCYIFSSCRRNDGETQDILESIYSDRMQAALERTSIIKGNHPLIAQGFVSADYEGMTVEEHLLRLFYGDAAEAYVGNNNKMDRYALVCEISEAVMEDRHFCHGKSRLQMAEEACNLEKANRNLSMVKNLMLRVPSFDDRIVFYVVCSQRIYGEAFKVNRLSEIFGTSKYVNCCKKLMDGSHELLKTGLIEISSDGMFYNADLELAEAGEELLFEEDADVFRERLTGRDIIQPDTVVEKRLFFDSETDRQLSSLRQSLHKDNYQEIIRKLAEKHLPTGVCVLLYGPPGTGKTESVMQLARQTGRAVIHVDISQTKSRWFGESEKIMKGVFARYRKLCKQSRIKPILLFNEADGVLSRRKDIDTGNLAQTEDAIQNIILEEMEKLDGIMVATTNLTDNLAPAFERRFLFKIRLNVPTMEAKCSIWMDRMPSLSKEDASVLANSFSFSGGEIENVVRKAEIENLLTGAAPTLDSIIKLCGKEKICSGRRPVGFAFGDSVA